MKTLLHKVRKAAAWAMRKTGAMLSQAMRGGIALVRACTGYAGSMLLLLAVVALELCVLGAGVIRRLENSYHLATEAARTELALLEAQELADELPNKGSAGIGATQNSTPPPAETTATAEDTPPPLRPRDVATIVAQETGTPLPETDDTTNTTATLNDDEPPAAPTETRVQSGSTENQEEAERLIRQGVAALTAGDMRLCVLSLEQALAFAPEHPALLYYYGLAYDKLLNPAKAREYYTKVFHMRESAGKYFRRASRRLTYGFEQPAAMRGKLAFGPHQARHTYSAETGENVDILLPILLAPGEEIRPDDIYITIQFFDLVNGRKIEFSRNAPRLAWQNEKPSWADWEENLVISYAVPPPTPEETDAYGELKYYGFTAKLYYKGEPLDCISTPSALILQEQRLNSRRKPTTAPESGLLPDDGLSPEEEATPFSEFLEEIDSVEP